MRECYECFVARNLDKEVRSRAFRNSEVNSRQRRCRHVMNSKYLVHGERVPKIIEKKDNALLETLSQRRQIYKIFKYFGI
jgi:hypothetical protein